MQRTQARLARAAQTERAHQATAQWDIPPVAATGDESGKGPHFGGAGRPAPPRGVLAGIAGVVLLFLFSVVGVGAFNRAQDGKLYDNVFVNEQNIGGMTKDAARTSLAQSLDLYLNGPITLTNENKQWTPKLADLGMQIDLDQTVDEAYQAGRSGGPLGKFWRALQTRQGARTYVPLYVRVDDRALNGYLDGLQTQLGTPPRDAAIGVKGNAIVVAPGADGVKLDRTVLQQQLLDTTAHLRETKLALPITFATPTVTTAQADEAKTRAEALVATPLSLTFNDKKWDLARDELVGALRFNSALDARVDAAALTNRVNAIAGELKQTPQNAVIGWDGQLVVRQPAKNEQRLNVEETLARINGWKGDVRTLALPVEVQKPRITDDVGALGITTRISRGVSNYAGSDAARAHNIEVAAGYLDDTVVAPGEVFSFLDSIGEITSARGYKDGYVILAEQTVPGVGGGVCQVATTMFRAAMFSGLPIEERNPHAYLVRYYEQGGYPVGLDAAVFSPGVDLKFRNETDKYMLVKTAVDGGNLYVSIYGPDLGYKVDLSDPVVRNKKAAPDDEYQIDPTLPPGTKKQVEFAKPGEDVTITRTVRAKDGAVVRQAAFNTHYQDWPNKFLIARDVTPPKKVAQSTQAPNTPVPNKTAQPTQPQATLPSKPQATATVTGATKPAQSPVPTVKKP